MKKLFSLPENATRQARAAIEYTLAVVVSLTLTFFIYLYLAFQTLAWQLFVAAGVSLVIVFITILMVPLIQKGRHVTAIRILIGAMLVICLLAPFIFADNIGSMAGVIIFTVILLLAIRIMPQSDLPRIIFIGLIALGAIVLIDMSAPASQISIPAAGTTTLIGCVLTVILCIFFIIREFPNIPLTSKLLLTFPRWDLAVCLLAASEDGRPRLGPVDSRNRANAAHHTPNGQFGLV